MCAIFLLTHTHNQLKFNTIYHFGVSEGFKNLVMKKPRRDLLYIRARSPLPIHYTPYTLHHPLHRGLAAKMAFEEGLNPLARFYWRDIFQN